MSHITYTSTDNHTIHDDVSPRQMFNRNTRIHAHTHTYTRAHTRTHTHTILRPLVRDNPGRPVPAETLTHSHPSYHRTSFINFLHLLQRNYGEIYTGTHISKHTKRLHTHTRLTALIPRLPRWASTRKVKPIWILLKQETVSGSGISWAICKSAPRSRQKTKPAPHHSVFLQAGCPSCRPTNGQGTEGKRLQNYKEITWSITIVQCPLDNFIIKKSHRHLTSYDRSVNQQQNASGSWIFWAVKWMSANLDVKGAGKLEATFSSHGLVLSVVKCMQCQVLNFLIVLNIHTNTWPFNGPFFRDYPGEPVPER